MPCHTTHNYINYVDIVDTRLFTCGLDVDNYIILAGRVAVINTSANQISTHEHISIK